MSSIHFSLPGWRISPREAEALGVVNGPRALNFEAAAAAAPMAVDEEAAPGPAAAPVADGAPAAEVVEDDMEEDAGHD